MFEKAIARTEAFLKGMAFDCHECGQCLLSETKLICPMSCPKGLRNGPCGGTIDGLCEVYPDKECVWVRIYKRVAKGATDSRELVEAVQEMPGVRGVHLMLLGSDHSVLPAIVAGIKEEV